ncbi:uncharacterized protein DEA37_0004190, partial [Paragonimus westermani]
MDALGRHSYDIVALVGDINVQVGRPDEPEFCMGGGRFKKLCFIQSHPCLLLIRDEAGPPDVQLANWIDALVLVVSLADVESVRIAHNYLALLRGLVDLSTVPMALVATQDSVINGTPAPEIEPHIRQLIAAMDSCPYYETCAVYGLNVQPVFEDILSRVLARRSNQKLPNLYTEPQPASVSDNHSFHSPPIADTCSSTAIQMNTCEAYTQLSTAPTVPVPSTLPSITSKHPTVGPAPLHPFKPQICHYPTSAPAYPNDLAHRPNFHLIPSWTEPTLQPIAVTQYRQLQPNPLSSSSLVAVPMAYRPELCASNNVRAASSISSELDLSGAHRVRSAKTAVSHAVCPSEDSALQTQPGSLVASVLNAPVHNRRLSNIFRRPDVDQGPTLSQALADEAADQGRRDRPRPQSTGSLTGGPLASLASATLCATGLHAPSPSAKQQQRDNLGGGRLIPIKQGCLYKLNTQRLSKETKRKKKYVVLTEDARLSYHPSKQDYIDGQHCKWIDLTISTVKLPGLPYRMSGGGTQLGTTSSSDTAPGSSSQAVADMCSSFILLSSPPTSQGTTTSTPVAQDGLIGVTSQLGSLSLMESSLSFHPASTDHLDDEGIHNFFNEAQIDVAGKKPPTLVQGNRHGGRALKEAMKRHYKRAKAAVTDHSTATFESVARRALWDSLPHKVVSVKH